MVSVSEDDFTTNPKTLCDWVKNFRTKKMLMKRKLRTGGNLRVCAILSTALMSAEHELRCKQQERFNRWLEVQAKLNGKLERRVCGDYNGSCAGVNADNEFVGGENSDDSTDCKRREEIRNLWKYELSGLDEFMRNMSSSSNKSGSVNNEIGANCIKVAS